MKLVNELAFVLLLISVVSCGSSKINVFSIGDSTMAQYDVEKLSKKYGGDNYPLRGWGMALPYFLKDNVNYVNGGKSGYSSKSYRSRGSWDEIKSQIKKGDFVIIQFGHNDQKINDAKRYTEANTEFKDNLRNYIHEVQALKAHPILATSIARRVFNEEGELKDSHGDYVKVTRQLADEEGIPLIDLNQQTTDYINKIGVDQSTSMFLHLDENEFSGLPDGLIDNTHLSIEGAELVAKMAVIEIVDSPSKLRYFIDKSKLK
ncbi:rhamnogalacturonan acetylesterase [Membranihabitans marinus]|uniref:rhamnogalacturonan acetylesterase n=1 Tax=Membranihabitans marinus TaxID=1227546 RepID=UPI001F4521A7|nr:rhamnogalacturonan acetylesterase [Membranihabitans marinus]